MIYWAVYRRDGELYALYPSCQEAAEEADAGGHIVVSVGISFDPHADDNEHYDMCLECTMALGFNRDAVFEAYFLTGLVRDIRPKQAFLCRRKIVKNFTANRQDPTSVNELECGHYVGY